MLEVYTQTSLIVKRQASLSSVGHVLPGMRSHEAEKPCSPKPFAQPLSAQTSVLYVCTMHHKGPPKSAARVLAV